MLIDIVNIKKTSLASTIIFRNVKGPWDENTWESLAYKISRAELKWEVTPYSLGPQDTDRWSTGGPYFTIIKCITMRIHKEDELCGEIQIIKILMRFF